MPTPPRTLTRVEWEEIGSLEAIRQSWGVEDSVSFADLAEEVIYGAKFDFVSGNPREYRGDVYILQGDTLTGDAPLVLIRDASGALDICDFG